MACKSLKSGVSWVLLGVMFLFPVGESPSGEYVIYFCHRFLKQVQGVESVDFTQPLRDGQPVDKTESKKESICSKPTAKWLSHPLTPSELTGEEVDDRIS